jgi:hypothetical protein
LIITHHPKLRGGAEKRAEEVCHPERNSQVPIDKITDLSQSEMESMTELSLRNPSLLEDIENRIARRARPIRIEGSL